MTRLAVLLPLALGLNAAQAQDFDPAALDLAAVAVLAGPCANCHGPGGVSPGAIPTIAGLPEDEATAKMLAFRAGDRPMATIMPRLMKGYDEAQIRALARWFAEMEIGQ